MQLIQYAKIKQIKESSDFTLTSHQQWQKLKVLGEDDSKGNIFAFEGLFKILHVTQHFLQ